jgi:mannose PTS system EIIA component
MTGEGMINILVITHGEFGAYLVEAAESIIGPQGSGVKTIGISSRMTIAEVRERVEKTVMELRTGNGLIILTDMPGGTPCNVAMPIAKDFPGVRVISGVNLYMLVTAFNHRRAASIEELTEKVLSAGRRAIADIKAMFLTKI